MIRLKLSHLYCVVTIAVLSAFSEVALADRYGIYEDEYLYEGSYRAGASDAIEKLFAAVLILALASAASIYFLSSCGAWLERRETGEKPEQPDGLFDWIMCLIGYGITTLFLVAPIILIAKWIDPVGIDRISLWKWCHGTALVALTLIRRT